MQSGTKEKIEALYLREWGQAPASLFAGTSIDVIHFAVLLEREFRIQFSLQELTSDSFKEFDSLVALVNSKLAARA